MKISISWLKKLIKLDRSIDELINLLPLSTIGTKEVTDKFIELDMKGYNRADLLSMRGVALEVAAITDSKVNFIDEDKFIWESESKPEAKVKVENPELVPLYCIAKIEGLKVSKSPDDWVNRLSDCGVRSINNIADVTNLIMLEYGQPMHAFDASKIKDETLIVRTAKNDEEIRTLDNKVRKLETSDLLITDCEKAVGIAGVMGGKNSEVTNDTKTILLEAAIFDPVTLRKTTQRLNLPSEASKRFQHGLTKKRALQALNAAIKMYQDLGGKLTAISIVGNTFDPVRKIELRKEKVDSLIGFDIPEKDIEKYLTQLNFKLASQGSTLQGWEVAIPYYRSDIEIEADLIEEIARMLGYEKIKPQELKGELPEKIDQSLFKNIYNLKLALAKIGLTEVQTYSFYSTDVLQNCQISKDNLIKISNPISAETEFLRNKLWSNLVEVVSKNIKQGFKEIAVFEIGKVYESQKDKLPKEEYKLAIALSDNSENVIQKLYTILQTLCSHRFDFAHGCSTRCGKLSIEQIKSKDESFHPVRFAKIVRDGKETGFIAEVHPRVTDGFGVKKRVAVLELDLTFLS